MSLNHRDGGAGERGGEPATFWEHLDVLRGEIIRMLLAAVLMAVVCFCLKEVLFEVVLAPSRADFFIYRILGTEPFDIHLINTGLTERFALSALSVIQVCLTGSL